jgi:RNA polymerase sigma-70 factor (ECF subfamily)
MHTSDGQVSGLYTAFGIQMDSNGLLMLQQNRYYIEQKSNVLLSIIKTFCDNVVSSTISDKLLNYNTMKTGSDITKEQTELLLIKQTINGDSSAIEVLYNKYYRKIFRIVYSWCKNRSTAEELTNDTFLTCFNKISTLQKPESFEYWLIGIAINLSRNALRKKNIQSESFEDYQVKDQNVENKKNFSLAVARALEQLPDGCKQIFILYEIHGFTHEEISKITGISIGSSKSQLFKAKRKLREILSLNKNIHSYIEEEE